MSEMGNPRIGGDADEAKSTGGRDGSRVRAVRLRTAAHFLVLRHRDGDDWAYVVIEHLGTKATVDAVGSPTPPNMRDLYASHGDTFVNGPAWAEFSRNMGLGQPAQTAGSVYAVSVYRAAPGQRDALEKMLNQPPRGGEKVAGMALFQYLEGAPWNYLTIDRYNSWADFAASETSATAQMAKRAADWFDMRNEVVYHADTLTDRIAP